MKLKFILFILISLSVLSLNAQIKSSSINFNKSVKVNQKNPYGFVRCSSVEYEEMLQQKFPNRLKNKEFEKWLAPLIKEQKNKMAMRSTSEATVITIPVVVHVIHNGDAVGTGENISDAQVRSQIKVLNEDYRRLLGSKGYNTNPVGADTQIEFCLASLTPNGDMTNGIDRKQFTNDSFTQDEVNSIVKPTTQWDPTKYFNIWTVNFTDNTMLGFAQFPSDSGLSGLTTNGGEAISDGVVILYKAFGSEADNDGTFTLNPYYNFGRTTTHEVGHWLGLKHIWGDGDCSVDDYCNDTPVAAAANYDCPASKDTCPLDPGVDMIENYMDYTKDACMNIFTIDQKTRMLTVLANSPRRKELTTAAVCNSDFSFSFTSDFKEACVGNPIVYNFTYNTYLGFNQPVTFSAINLPAGVTATFNPSSATANNTNVTVTLNGISDANLGNHLFKIMGSYAAVSKGTNVQLVVYNSVFQPLTLVSPINNSINTTTPTELKWNTLPNVKTYQIEVASNASFSNIVETASSSTNTFRTKLLSSLTTYYWRVKAINPCGQSSYSVVNSFTTANILCNDFVATDIPKTILATDPNTVISNLIVNEPIDLTYVKVKLNITHTWDEDLTISLISPKGTVILLSRENGGDGKNYTNTIFDDYASNSIASGTAPFSGSFKPLGALSALIGEKAFGNWQLKVVDGYSEDGGSLQNWTLSLCGIPTDIDKDRIDDSIDNCPLIYNPLQEDNDKDGLGDACDPDDDNDGVLDVNDNCPFTYNPDQKDNDHDGIGDVCDDDDDNDGVLDVNDNCQFGYNPDQSDVNYDGIGDVCEDCNKDGIPYYIDNFICEINIIPGFSPNGDGINDFFIINNIELHTDNKVQLFNRWGNKVFEKKNYLNTWDGISTEGGGGSKLLPAGPYFYVIEINETGVKPVTGWIYINY